MTDYPRSDGGGDMAEKGATVALAENENLDYLDGLHHAWCKDCYPQWANRLLGAELGVPFTAWCGQRAIFLAVWQSDDTPPGPRCPICWSDPLPPCATCGRRVDPDA